MPRSRSPFWSRDLRPIKPVRLIICWTVLAAVASLQSPHALAQDRSGQTAQANSLVRDAILYAARGDTAAALDRLERATRLAPGLAEAHYRRGLLLANQAGTAIGDLFKRRAAAGALDRAIRIDNNNPYYLLELGRLRLKQGFMRIAAARLFNRALRAAREKGDPAVVAEIEGELGDIYQRRYQSLANRRLLTGSVFRFDPDEAIDNPHYARDFLAQRTSEIDDAGELDLRLAEEHYRAGVATWMAHDASTAGLLGLLYDKMRYEEFLEVARGFVRAAQDNARAHLFYGLGLWRLNREREANRAFARALRMMSPAHRAQITDLSVILRRNDAGRYQQLSSAQRAEFDRIYWSANDPLLLTRVNEHQLEHLARVAYTDLRFTSKDLNLRGWATDRGAIYIRYGPPPVIASFAPNVSRIGDDIELLGKVVTVWFYPERNLRFVFYGPPGYNFARFAGEFKTYAEDARYTSPVRYDNVPVNEALDSIPVQTAALRPVGDSADLGRTQLVFYAGLPLKRMVAGVDLAEGPLESGLFITDPLQREVLSRNQQETVKFGSEDQFETRTYFAQLKPGEYLYRVEARQPVTRRAARGMSRISVESFDRAALQLSDIILADRVAPRVEEPGALSDFLVDPNAAMRYTPGDAVHLYWETYNLQPDSAATVRFETELVIRVQSIERSEFGARVVGGLLDAVGASARGDEQVTLSYESEKVLAGRDRIPSWLAVDLAGAPNGTYTLEITVTDLMSGQAAVRRRTFSITDMVVP